MASAGTFMRPCGDFRRSYSEDTVLFDEHAIKWWVLAMIAAVMVAPFFVGPYYLNLMIQIGYLGIAALGLNILVGFTGQISIGHAAFFGFGAFASVWISGFGIPVFFSIPLAGLLTAAVGLIFGVPAARIKGLYLAIATLAAQFILQDFFARASWFTGGVAGAMANPVNIFGFELFTDETYIYLVLVYVIVMYALAANLMRSRDGRALIAVRDQYLAAEIMGINLTKYRILSFGIGSFYAGIGGALYAHYLGFVSIEAFTILFSIQFLAMVIIGGLGSIKGTLFGAAFMVLLPEVMNTFARGLSGSFIDRALALGDSISFLQEMAIGIAIIAFLIFEPDGLNYRWGQIRKSLKLYPFSY